MRSLVLSALVLFVFSPLSAAAFPFGGRASMVIPCFNNAIFANVGPPVGGTYIWTPATRTYRFGAPTHAGQWLLGLASIPYYCIVSIQPIIVFPGVAITMLGTSQ